MIINIRATFAEADVVFVRHLANLYIRTMFLKFSCLNTIFWAKVLKCSNFLRVWNYSNILLVFKGTVTQSILLLYYDCDIPKKLTKNKWDNWILTCIFINSLLYNFSYKLSLCCSSSLGKLFILKKKSSNWLNAHCTCMICA